jgi:uncharacterized protein YbjT (DUF2867 family)
LSAVPTIDGSRVALLAGASGLVGRSLLTLLLESARYRRVHALLRRSVPGLPAHPKLCIDVVDFERLPAQPPLDDVYLALGTTIEAAGSKAGFRRVDFDAVLDTARAGRTAGAKRLLVVSALGADASSRVFYNRVKGEMEQAVTRLGFDSLVIARPSLLLGDRSALGQPTRVGEAWTARLLRPALAWVPSTVRPIRADAVARAMLHAAFEARAGVRVLTSREMQAYARSG